MQWFSAAGAGTITTIRYPAQLRAISCTFLPTAVLQKLGYHYTAAQLVDRMETGDACSGLSLCVCPAPDSPHPPLACAVRCCGEMINYPRHATWNKSSVRCHILLCDMSRVTCHEHLHSRVAISADVELCLAGAGSGKPGGLVCKLSHHHHLYTCTCTPAAPTAGVRSHN